MRRADRSLRSAVSLGFAAGCLAAVAASCGSRTPLLGGGEGEGPGSSADGGDAAVDASVPCVPGKFTLDLANPQLMFVIDRSGSMAFALDGGSASPTRPSRWATLESALRATIVPFDAQLAMGAKFFPDAPSGRSFAEGCLTSSGVGIAPARGNATAILDVFRSTRPLGGTPTAEAMRVAADYLSQTRGVARTMVLATDGAPNCNPDLDAKTCTCTASGPVNCANSTDGAYDCLDDLRAVSVIGDIFGQRNIPVYVIGIGGAENAQYLRALDDMAIAGGRARPSEPRYYDARTASDLAAALTSVRDSVAKCTYLTPSAPTDPDAITVEVDGTDVQRDTTHVSGWDWIDRGYGELQFFGDACVSAASGTTRVVAVVSCPDR